MDTKIVNTQRAITPKIGKSGKIGKFMCSARRLMVFNVCVKFHKNMSRGFKVMEWTRKIVNTQRAITQKVEKTELQFMCSARRLMVINVCVKFHENMSSCFKVMERTRKLLTHTHTEKRRKHYTPMAYFVCRGYKQKSYTKNRCSPLPPSAHPHPL